MEPYFVLRPEVGSVPHYEYRGGTVAVSDMLGLDLAQRIRYVHQHSLIQLPDCQSPERSLKAARESLDAARKGQDPVKHLTRALTQVHPDEEEMISEIQSEFEQLNLGGVKAKEEEKEEEEEGGGDVRYKVEYREGVGRHVVAVSDIRAGEEIIRESAGVSCLHWSHRETNCGQCCVALPGSTATACPGCQEVFSKDSKIFLLILKYFQVLYCSLACLRLAAVHHMRECGQLQLLPGLGPLAPVCRIFTARSSEFFISRAGWFQQYDRTGDSEGQETTRRLFNLQAGSKRDSQYNITKAVYSYYLISILKKLKYFSDNSPASLDSEHLTIGRFIDHFLRIADDNCHEICQLEKPAVVAGKSFDELFEGEESVIRVVGVAIYPRISLFNNSCDVNTFKYHRGNREVIVARRDIRAGEEITDFYGEYYFQTSKLLRRRNLSFNCGCLACKEDWPLLDSLPTFDYEEVEARYDWALARVALESALSHLDLRCIADLCLKLGDLVNVVGPHQAKVLPELYLSYSYLALYGNQSLNFRQYNEAVLSNSNSTT